MTREMRKAWLVSHTHWDREWYWTFPRFRVRLAQVVDQVLDRLEDDGPFRHFVLDGQALVLEDYLQVRPGSRERLQRLAAAGALSLGPWYVLSDEFLVSGESTVRNLLLGHEVAASMGAAQKVGYVPDSFGHIAQMPQILRRAGLDSFIYTRGNGDEIDDLGWEYEWVAPDGSHVLAVNQCGGYCNAGGLGYEELWHAHTARRVQPDLAVEQVGTLLEKMARRPGSEVVLLNNGCDHFPPQQEFPAILDALRQANPGITFSHGSLEEYVADLRAVAGERRRFTGELAGGRLHHILSGVWSARMPLKQTNDSCQTWLADVAEPLASAALILHGHAYPEGELKWAWKRLLQNHPHDSICGCSIDPVHRQMQARFLDVEETAGQVTRDRLTALAPTFARSADDDRHTTLVVANPLPRRRSEVVRRLIVLQPFGEDPQRLRLYDEAGQPLPFRLLQHWYVERFWGVDYRTLLHVDEQMEVFQGYLDTFSRRMVRPEGRSHESDLVLLVEFLARDIPGVGHAIYRLDEDGSREPLPPAMPQTPLDDVSPAVTVGENVLDNGLVRVQAWPDGTLDLIDLASGRVFSGLNALVDGEDIGDEYDHGALPQPHRVRPVAADGSVEPGESGGLSGKLVIRQRLTLPAGVSEDRSRRRQETVDCPLQIAVTLQALSPVVHIDLRFDNRACDHRLQVEMPSGLDTECFVTDNQFVLHQRHLDIPAGENWAQDPVPTRPQQEYSLVHNDGAGLALFNRGLPEIAGRRDNGGLTLVLTLLRSVGWLSRDDFAERRRTNAGPTLATPEAQCLGPQRFHYALMPFTGDPVQADVKGWSRRFRVPLLTLQGVADGHQAGAGLLTVEEAQVCVSAVKKHETRDALVVRLYNITDADTVASLSLGRPVAGAWRVDLLEDRLKELPVYGDGRLSLPLGPHEIATLEIAFT